MPIFDSETLAGIAISDDKFLIFAVVRNEIVRLPAWLSHYRSIGCQNFVVIDNGSTDGTYEFLQEQADVSCTRTDESFAKSNCGINWLNELRMLIGERRWILAVDADELFVYRGWPERKIVDLIDEAEGAKCNAIWAFMLDMYPDGPIDPVIPPRLDNMFNVAPCFDQDYKFQYPEKNPGKNLFLI